MTPNLPVRSPALGVSESNAQATIPRKMRIYARPCAPAPLACRTRSGRHVTPDYGNYIHRPIGGTLCSRQHAVSRLYKRKVVIRTLKTLLAVGFAGSLLGYPLAGAARVYVDIDIAPSPVVIEDAPVRQGYIYAPGYWDWDDAHHRHVWMKGEYMRERQGERWVPHTWVQRNGRYHFNEGHWDHGQ